MKKKYSRILGVTLTLMLVASLFAFATPVSAGDVEWDAIQNPSTSVTKLHIANVDVGPIAVTPDGGTLFAPVLVQATIAGLGATGQFGLVQSTDGGHFWEPTGLINQPGIINGVAVSSNFASDGLMYVASGITVFRSTDSGVTFIALKPILDSGGLPITAINSIAMWPGTPSYVMVGTDRDVLVLRDSVFEDWRDQELGNPISAVEVAFAPDFATSNYIWAVTAAGVVTCTNSPGAWGNLLADTPALPPVTATITYAAATGIVVLTAGPGGATVTYSALANVAGAPATGTALAAGATCTLTAAGATGTQTVAVTGGSASIVITPTGGTITSMDVTTGLIPLPSLGAINADIAFPDDYNSATSPYMWVGIDSGASNMGGVWRVRGLPIPGPSQIVQQYGVGIAGTAATDVRSLAASGTMASSTILLGLQSTATIVKSLNGGVTWPLQVFKQPTGAGATFVIMAPDFATSSVAYVGTSGATESAFQMSGDGGVSWDQTGLIDTTFTAINDIAVVSKDTIFVVSNNQALWKVTNADVERYEIWTRILTAATVTLPANPLTAGGTLDSVEISPDFLTDGVVYATNMNVAPPNTGVMKAIDGGGIFAPMGAPGGAITAMLVLDATFAFTGSVGQLYRTDDGAYSWLAATTAPAGTVASIAIAPNYTTSGEMMVGTTTGAVRVSEDWGATFATISGGPSGISGTSAYVTFDPSYTGAGAPFNRNLYAVGGSVIRNWRHAWSTIDTGPTGAATAAVAGDTFSIMGALAGPTSGFIQVTPDTITFTASGAAADAGTITVTAPGSVTVAVTGTATIGATATAGTIVNADGAVAFTTPAAADTVVISASTTATAGTWTITGGAPTAAVTLDRDGDSAIAGAPGAWNLVDAFSGSVSVTTWGMATYVPATGAYTVSTIGDIVDVTATTAGTTGCWTIATGTGTAAITVDVDGDATVTLAAGAFSLPDVGTAATTGASAFNAVVVSPDGTLYAANGGVAGAGLERSLNPTAALLYPDEGAFAPVFETVAAPNFSRSLLMGVWLVVDGTENVVFSIDTYGGGHPAVDQILHYTDTLPVPVVLTSPEDGAIFPRVEDVSLDWETLTGATSYRWEIARDDAFRVILGSDDTFYPNVTATGLFAGQTYYWRVRVDSAPGGPPGAPILSRWSETRSFTTELGGRVWHPFTNIAGVAPGPGAQDVLTMPAFQWNGADWATSYELLLADNPDFTGATTKTLTTTSWVSDTDLGYSTTYYWKVRALSATSESEWSDVGVFTTMAESAPPIVVEEVQPPVIEVIIPEAPPAVEVTPVAPAYLLAIIIIGAVLVIFVIVLIVRTRRPI